MASTAPWPCARGGLKPNVASRRSSSSSLGISVMPTVRSPCTLEWPRNGQMPAPCAPDLAAHQHQVGELLHHLRAVPVLRQAHAVAEDDVLGVGVDLRRALDLAPRQAGAALDVLPLRRLDVANKGVVAGRVVGDERAIDDLAAVLALEGEQGLHQALHDCRVAADTHLMVDGGDLCRPPGQHLDRMLRRQEALRARAPSAG